MRMQKYFTLWGCLFIAFNLQAQEVKNLIFMIPDGASISTLPLTRWYNFYKDSTKTRLAIDPYICGLVKTHSSNAPIGDSAPTTTAYTTGYLSQTGFVGMYPPPNINDLVHIDSALAYSPRTTIGEALRIEKNKATGLVFTCEFPHATPADNFAHTYKRSDYPSIQNQMVHNHIDVVIGGGAGLLTPEQKQYLETHNYSVILNDLQKFKTGENPQTWALFADQAMPNNFDRNPAQYPALQEMTQKAIDLLSQNPNGFFLMIEGSKIDWASHRNDPIGIISEMSAFDEAVETALNFAKKDGNTAVIIVPDHSNGGLSIGNSNSNGKYDKLSLTQIIHPLTRCQKTAEGLTVYLKEYPMDSIAVVISREWGITPTEAEIQAVEKAKNTYAKGGKNYERDNCTDIIARILQSRSYIGFTTNGHSGEDVFLALYHPRNQKIQGLITAPELNTYMCQITSLTQSLDSLSNTYYSKYTQVFDQKTYKFIQSGEAGKEKLFISNKKNIIEFEANKNIVKINEKVHELKTPAIYVDKNNMWYISKECLQFLH